MYIIERARCHGKKEVMRRAVQKLKDSGFCNVIESNGIVFNTYKDDTCQDDWVKQRFLADDNEDKWITLNKERTHDNG